MTQTGIFIGTEEGATERLAAYTSWAGEAPDNVLSYLNDGSWSGFDSSISYAFNQNSHVPGVWSVPLTVEGTSLEEVGTGAHNDHFLKAAQQLAQATPSSDGNIYVRVGWEFNGDWMPWSSAGHEAAYVESFDQVVETFRSVPGGENFKFVWDANQDTGVDPAQSYPGDKYVDVVGMDLYYNKQWDNADPAAAFQDKVTTTYGLQWQQDFAAAHGKGTAISEWGVNTDDAGPFIKAMADWTVGHNMVYENYWNDGEGSGYYGKLSDGHLPSAAAAYKERMKIFYDDQRSTRDFCR